MACITKRLGQQTAKSPRSLRRSTSSYPATNRTHHTPPTSVLPFGGPFLMTASSAQLSASCCLNLPPQLKLTDHRLITPPSLSSNYIHTTIYELVSFDNTPHVTFHAPSPRYNQDPHPPGPNPNGHHQPLLASPPPRHHHRPHSIPHRPRQGCTMAAPARRSKESPWEDAQRGLQRRGSGLWAGDVSGGEGCRYAGMWGISFVSYLP